MVRNVYKIHIFLWANVVKESALFTHWVMGVLKQTKLQIRLYHSEGNKHSLALQTKSLHSQIRTYFLKSL